MSRASPQVQSKESKQRTDITSGDVFDVDNDDTLNDERVIDMMSTGLSAPQLLRHLEVISGREFPYESITERARDPEGNIFEFENAGRSLAYEAFMEQAVIVEISETTDERASPVVYIAINGDERWLPRGVPVKLPRKFIERLAQSAERGFRTPKINATEDTDNERPVKSKSTQAYPFSIIRDSNPNAKLTRSWLKRVTKQST